MSEVRKIDGSNFRAPRPEKTPSSWIFEPTRTNLNLRATEGQARFAEADAKLAIIVAQQQNGSRK